jgi:polysaccharide export outer membrane protein
MKKGKSHSRVARFVVRLTVGFSLALGAAAQAPQQQTDWNRRIEQLSFAGKAVTGEYRVGNGDLIEIRVFGEDEFNQTTRIGPSGEITMPYLGKVAIGGLTQYQIEERLKSELGQKVLQNPQVTVFVKEYRSQPVFVLGAVKLPGQYQITQRMNVVDAIAMGGGLDLARAGDRVVLQRPPAADNPSARPETIEIDLKELLEKGNLALNLPLQGGDIVQVPERVIETFYVIGEVNRPGVFELPVKQQLYLTQALARAGGPMKTAKTKKGTLVRFDQKGGRQEIALNFDAILKGKKPDVLVGPNDVIFIPGSTFKNIGYGLLGVIPNTVSSTVSYGAYR